MKYKKWNEFNKVKLTDYQRMMVEYAESDFIEDNNLRIDMEFDCVASKEETKQIALDYKDREKMEHLLRNRLHMGGNTIRPKTFRTDHEYIMYGIIKMEEAIQQ